MPNDHDRRYKYLFSHAGFVRRLLEGFVDEAFVDDLDFETLQRVDGEFIDEEFTRRESDIVWRVLFRGRPVYLFILIEFQSTVDYSMALRFLRYVTGLYESLHANLGVKRLPAVFPILVYNGERNWTAAVAFQDLVEQTIPVDYIPHFRYYPIIEKNFGRANLRRMRNAVAALFYFETSPAAEIEAHMRDIVDILKEEEPGLVSAFGNWLTHWGGLSEQHDRHLLRLKQALMKLQEDAVASLFQRTFEEELQKNRRKGLQEGRRETALNTARKLLARGMDPQEIADLVELNVEEVRALENEGR